MFAFFHFNLFVCFGDRLFSLGFVPIALLNSPIAILKVTPPLPVPSQGKKEEGKETRTGRFLTRLEKIFRHSISYLTFLF